MNEVIEKIEVDNESLQKIFGAGDMYVKKLEKNLNVSVIDRNGEVTVRGEEKNVKSAVSIIRELKSYSGHGNDIE